MDGKDPIGRSLRVHRESPFTELKPETLMKRGFRFYLNLPYDTSLEHAGAISFATARTEKDLRTDGVATEEEPRIVIRNLDTLVRASLQNGMEVKLVRGQYAPRTKSFTQRPDTVAAFQRFMLEPFISKKPIQQLLTEDWQFVDNLSLHEWGDDLQKWDDKTRPLLIKENGLIEQFVHQQAEAGFSATFVPGLYVPEKRQIERAQSLAALVRAKERK